METTVSKGIRVVRTIPWTGIAVDEVIVSAIK
jgi:hypothetical protein